MKLKILRAIKLCRVRNVSDRVKFRWSPKRGISDVGELKRFGSS